LGQNGGEDVPNELAASLLCGFAGADNLPVYTLWRNPKILPLIHTPAAVVQKMQNGADLMTPGLAGPPFPKGAKQGAIVAVASLENPSTPLAVGLAEIDISSLRSTQGVKGHAVQTIHTYKDELWSWSASGKPGLVAPEQIDEWLERNPDDLAGQIKQLELDDETDPVPNSQSKTLQSHDSQSNPSDGKVVDGETLAGTIESREFTTAEIDKAFRNAFLYGVYRYKETNQGTKNFGLDFPLTQSFVMANLVQPFLPAFTPAEEAQLNIKKTSWKNIKKFIKSLDKEMIIKSKDRDGNQVVVLDIDFEDRHLATFKPYSLPKKETSGGQHSQKGEKDSLADNGDDSIGQKLKRVELFRAKEKHESLFEASKSDSRAFYTAAELKSIITTYIETENLVSTTNRRLVKLNPFLANAIFDGQGTIDKEVINKGAVPRDALIDRIVGACSPYWVLLRNNASSSETKPKAGAFPLITVTLETRSGNKTVTKVSGLESFYIGPQYLADELKKTCAGSTSVERLAGSSPKTPVMEVMVQGPQREAVLRALEKRGVAPKWVEVVDKTKGKKKG